MSERFTEIPFAVRVIFPLLIAFSMLSGITRATPYDGTIVNLVARARHGIVNIEARIPLVDQMGPFGKILDAHLKEKKGHQRKWYLSLGSGVVWDRQGHVVTTRSVVKSSDQIIVRTQDGQSFTARLVGYDDITNIAVLNLNAELPDRIHPIDHRPDKMPEGSWLVLMGYGYGGIPTISPGMAGVPPEDFDPSRHWFQFTAPLRPGNSGSALIDCNGRLAGIALGREEDIGFNAVVRMLTSQNQNPVVSAESSSYSSLGVGIPINQMKHIVEQIIRSGRVMRGWIGVSVSTQTGDPVSGTGLRVIRIIPGSPADDAGLKVGDYISCVNGMDVTDPRDLGRMVHEFTPGSRIPVDFSRDGESLRTEVIILERPDQRDLIREEDHFDSAPEVFREASQPDAPADR